MTAVAMGPQRQRQRHQPVQRVVHLLITMVAITTLAQITKTFVGLPATREYVLQPQLHQLQRLSQLQLQLLQLLETAQVKPRSMATVVRLETWPLTYYSTAREG